MEYAIEVLSREILILKNRIEILEFESDKHQYGLVGTERPKRLIQLEQALKVIKNNEEN